MRQIKYNQDWYTARLENTWYLCILNWNWLASQVACLCAIC